MPQLEKCAERKIVRADGIVTLLAGIDCSSKVDRYLSVTTRQSNYICDCHRLIGSGYRLMIMRGYDFTILVSTEQHGKRNPALA